MLDGGAQQRVDQLLEDDLAGNRLRDLEDRREVEMPDGRADGASRVGSWLDRAEVRMELVELPHLAVGAPEQVPVPGLPKIEMREPLDAPRRVEARSEFARERLAVDETVRPGRH